MISCIPSDVGAVHYLIKQQFLLLEPSSHLCFLRKYVRLKSSIQTYIVISILLFRELFHCRISQIRLFHIENLTTPFFVQRDIL